MMDLLLSDLWKKPVDNNSGDRGLAIAYRREELKASINNNTSVIHCHCCMKKGHTRRDCRNLMKTKAEEAKFFDQANIATQETVFTCDCPITDFDIKEHIGDSWILYSGSSYNVWQRGTSLLPTRPLEIEQLLLV